MFDFELGDSMAHVNVKDKPSSPFLKWLANGELSQWLEKAQVGHSYGHAVRWCVENGAISVPEIRDDEDTLLEFVGALKLKRLDLKRLKKV